MNLKSKAHFLDTLKSDILEDNENEPCECCGIYYSEGVMQVTDERDNSSENLRLCRDCYINIERKRNPNNLMFVYSVSQVVK